MKKTLGFIAALCAAVVLVFAGCTNAGDFWDPQISGPEGGGVKGDFWLATDDTGEDACPDNKILLTALDGNDMYVRIFFNPLSQEIQDEIGTTNGSRARLMATIEFEILGDDFSFPFAMWQAAWDDAGQWGRSSTNLDDIDSLGPGDLYTVSVRPWRTFTATEPWGWSEEYEDMDPALRPTRINLKTLRGLCIQIPFVEGETWNTFHLINLKWELVDL